MGGAHNVLLQAVAEGEVTEAPKPGYNGPSQASMGGAHNVAMSVLAEHSRQFKA